MSAAKYSGTGAQATSANSGRSPAANTCTNFIGSREMAGRRRIPMLPRTSPGPTVRSRALCREYDGGGFVPRQRRDFCGRWVPGFLPGDTFTQSNRNIQMVKVGINYLFNWSGYRY